MKTLLLIVIYLLVYYLFYVMLLTVMFMFFIVFSYPFMILLGVMFGEKYMMECYSKMEDRFTHVLTPKGLYETLKEGIPLVYADLRQMFRKKFKR